MEKQNILNKIKNKFIELLMKPQQVSFFKFFFNITMYTLIVFNSEFITRFSSIPEVSDNIFITLTIPFVLISVIILFTSIKWTLLLTQRKFKLTRPKLWKL